MHDNIVETMNVLENPAARSKGIGVYCNNKYAVASRCDKIAQVHSAEVAKP